MLEQQFLDHTSKASNEDYLSALEAIDHGPNANLSATRTLSHARGRSRAATALPGKYADELDAVSARRVPRAETGDISDPSMSNLPVVPGKQRHVTTNEPPLPEVPSNMTRGKIGVSGVVQDRVRDTNRLIASRNTDPQNLLTSFAPEGTRLKEFEWNEGGALGVHQGLGVRFANQSTFNRYGRSVNPRDIPKKEPLPTVYDPRAALPAPLTTELAAIERELAPRVRDKTRADFYGVNFDEMRPPVKEIAQRFAPPGRPDLMVHKSRRDNPEPRLTRLEAPYIARSRGHALAAGQQARASMRQLIAENF